MTLRDAEQRIQSLFDNTIEENELSELEEALALDPALREIYKDYALLHGQLTGSHDSAAAPPLVPTPRPSPPHRLFLRSIGIAAAIVGLLSLALYFHEVTTRPPVLTLQAATGSRLQVTHADGTPGETGASIPPGATIEVEQGTVSLEFTNGIRSVISGPANLTYLDPEQIRLHEGTAWFRVPPEGVGFRVHTAGMTVTDLGTEFGIIHAPGSTEEVHVFEGRVHVASRFGFKSSEELTAGHSRRVGIRGDLEVAPGLSQPFLTALPDGLPLLHLPFDEVEGDRTPVLGRHPALDGLVAQLTQSDDRDPQDRLVNGRFGKAVRFDGLGDLVETNWPGVYGSHPLTISLWFKPDGPPSYAGLVGWGLGKEDTAAPRQWKLVLAPPGRGAPRKAAFRCAWGRSSTASQRVSLTQAEWMHLAIVFDSSEPDAPSQMLRFYLDGERLPSRLRKLPEPPQRPRNLSDASPMIFGDRISREATRQHFLKGCLDEVFIIEGALTDDQIRQLYERNTYR